MSLLSSNVKYYALFLLTVLYTLSFMDRIMLGMLMQPIKDELFLSDTQLGFLTGIAFALFYATLGIPIARWADRGNRVSILAWAMSLWGFMVMLCGVVTGFVQLLAVRIGAAVGDAGCMPPAYSLLGDYFTKGQRTRALSAFMSAVSISIVLSYVFAGWINENYGWRLAFILTGIPGIVLALLARLTLPEPRQRASRTYSSNNNPGTLTSVLASLWRRETFRYLLIALALVNFVGIGLGQWLPSHYIRSFGMATGELGLWMGLVGGLSGVIGTFLGGYLLDRFFGRSPRIQLFAISLGVAFFPAIYAALLFTSDRFMALILLVPLNVASLFFYGPVMSLIQNLVPDYQRATAIAIALLFLNLVGMGLGPQVVGVLSDFLMDSMTAAQSLRLAMAMASAFGLVAAWYFWRAGQSIDSDPVYDRLQNARGSASCST